MDGAPDPAQASGPEPVPQADVPMAAARRKGEKLSPREALESTLAAEPRNPEAWRSLIDLALRMHDMADIRRVYDRFFDVYPNASAEWIAYAELELAQSNFAQVDAIFMRCLRSTLSLDLWKFYLAYTRRVNPLPPYTGEEHSARDQTRRVLEGAYEFALKYVGWDHESSSIWQDYIALIRSREANGSWQEGQKMDQLRRVYQRAVSVPLDSVEAIWREYDAYENGLNKVTAKKFLGEKSPAYMQARTVLRELKNRTKALVRPALPTLPHWIAPHLSSAPTSGAEREHYAAWHRYLEWEASNPLMLDDPAALQARVIAVFRQAVMYIRFDPVVWHMAARFCTSVRRPDAAQWLRSGMAACPWSLLLHYTYAEHAAADGQYADGVAALDALAAYLGAQIDARLAALAERHAQVDAEMDAARQKAVQRLQQLDSAPDEDEPATTLADIDHSVISERAERKRQLDAQAAPQLDELRAVATQLWIKYMHFVRRAEGIRATRQVFGRARRSAHCTWPVYEANALLEYHCSKDVVVATKVFELALKTFGAVPALVVRYLDYLIAINDDTNARAVFERTISGMPPEHARIVCARWAAYEYCYGDASAVGRLDARLDELCPDESAVERAANRTRYGTLDMVRVLDLGEVPSRARERRRERAAERAEKSAAKEAESAGASDAPEAPDAGAPPRTMEEIRRSLVEGEKRPAAGAGTPAAGATGAAPAAKKAKTEPRRSGTPSGVPEALTYFAALLPPAAQFDGPVFAPDAIFECLQHTSLPIVALESRRRGGRRHN